VRLGSCQVRDQWWGEGKEGFGYIRMGRHDALDENIGREFGWEAKLGT